MFLKKVYLIHYLVQLHQKLAISNHLKQFLEENLIFASHFHALKLCPLCTFEHDMLQHFHLIYEFLLELQHLQIKEDLHLHIFLE